MRYWTALRFASLHPSFRPSLVRAKAAKKKKRVDDSHLPTVYRVGFLDALGDAPGTLQAADFDFAAIDAELQPESDRLGKRLMQLLEDGAM